MKGRSIKSQFASVLFMGALFSFLIAATGIYGTVWGNKEIERLFLEQLEGEHGINHIKEDIRDARVSLLTMVTEKDMAKKIVHRDAVYALAAHTAIDFEALINSRFLIGRDAVISRLTEARSVWEVFREARDNKLVSMILAGNEDVARELASTIQQERYLNMVRLLNDASAEMEDAVSQRHKEVAAKIRNLTIAVIFIMIVGLGFWIFVLYAYSIDIVARIGALKEGAKRLSEGDMSFRVAHSGEDEIAVLGAAFNSMADWIQEDIDMMMKSERELQSKNERLNEAMVEAQQQAKVIEFAAKEKEKHNKMLVDMQTQLLNSEKMASVGLLAAGVAHEINNPVGFVNGNMSTLSAYVEDIRVLNLRYEELVAACREEKCEKVRELEVEIGRFREAKDMEFVFEDLNKLVSESRHGLERVTSIVRDLKSFSHIGEAEAKEFDINKGLDSTINIAWSEIKYKAEVKKNYGNIPMVYCYPQQLNQVFMNILVNAAHAMENNNGKGLIGFRTYHGGEYVFVEISDNGCGIPEDKIKNIFDPFFTTKPVGKGTGLGLSLAYNIIKKHKGEIGVKSRVGEGTTFTIKLPVSPVLEGTVFTEERMEGEGI